MMLVYFLFLFIVVGVAGEQEVKFAALDEALPPALFAALPGECEAVHAWSTAPAAAASLIHGKRPTFWYDMQQPPRNNIEAAVLELRKLIPADILGSSLITGAEWWVQIRAKEEGIGFHYDKDEGLASLKGIMKHPELSTVTYLGSTGAPTLILNMTTPDGNAEVPDIPDMGYLSFPRVNRHIIFSGNLQHGVLGSAAPKVNSKRKSALHKRRITLLINWWTEAPIEPNTVTLTDELAKAMHLFAPESVVVVVPAHGNEQDVSITGDSSSSPTLQHEPRTVSVATLEIPDRSISPGSSLRHQIEFPPGDMHFMYLPLSIEKEKIYQAKWAPDQVYGSVGKLDLLNSNQVGQLFRMPQPKFMFLYDHKDERLYESLLQAALPLAKDLVGKVKFYFCPTNTCADVHNVFGLPKQDLPRAVIDDTAAGTKYVQNKTDWEVSRQAFESFILSSTPNAIIV